MWDGNTTREDMYLAICQNTSQLLQGLAQVLNADVADLIAKVSTWAHSNTSVQLEKVQQATDLYIMSQHH